MRASASPVATGISLADLCVARRGYVEIAPVDTDRPAFPIGDYYHRN